jgi:hypothetical protein
MVRFLVLHANCPLPPEIFTVRGSVNLRAILQLEEELGHLKNSLALQGIKPMTLKCICVRWSTILKLSKTETTCPEFVEVSLVYCIYSLKVVHGSAHQKTVVIVAITTRPSRLA